MEVITYFLKVISTTTTNDFNTIALATLISLATILLISTRSTKKIHLLDFSLYLPPASCRIPISTFIEHAKLEGCYTETELNFQAKLLSRSCIGTRSCMPPSIFQIPPDMSLSASLLEVETILFPTVASLLEKTQTNPKSIDIIVSNCSLFCPTPSISAMVVRKFNMRSNIMSYNLSGMGCSAGIVAVGLVRDLLRVHKEKLALVVSMEAVGPNGYCGKRKSMLLPNCLFRMGGAAILLSNKKRDKTKSKYVLQHVVRTHLGRDDDAYNCVYHEPDEEGYVGVSLSRALLRVAGEALKVNISTLGPKVLPYSEILKYILSLFPLKSNSKPYIPNFKKAFDHFCIHAGGRAVIDAIEKRLSLTSEDVEASRMTLFRFGNTSSSSVWYELGYLEAKGRVKKGHKVWQIGFGSGFKCNSAVWVCTTDLEGFSSVGNAWAGEIDEYPVEVPEIQEY